MMAVFCLQVQSTQAGGDIPFHYGDIFSPDANIIKTDAEGNIEWLKNLGGTGIDACIGSPLETSPGVYLVHIYSTSDDNDLADNGIDAFQKRWVVALNNLGGIENETFYEAEENLRRSDGQTGIISGNRTITIGSSEASSTLFPAPEGHLGEEGAIGIFSADLELTDVKMFGGSGSERFYKYFQDVNQNYYFIGYSYSTDYDLPSNYSGGEANDYWILKTDSNFNKIWSRNFGGSYESGELSGVGWDGDFVLFNNQIICFLPSVPQGELPDFDIQCGFIPDPPPPFRERDAWMVAFDLPTNINEPQITQQELTIFPNPNNGIFQIQFKLKSPETLLSVYNLNGEIIYSTQLYGKNTYDINLFELTNGIYYISAIGNDLIYETQLLIIQK
ncbi:MAG: T9SS type A sorting domain-containing protein [Chitinophagaceae bacterium]